MNVQIYRAETLHTASTPARLERAELWVAEGRVVALKPQGEPAPLGATVRECAHLCPGFIDAHTHLGLMPEGFSQESKDLNELTRPVTPTLRALDGLWPGDVAFQRARAGGVTTVCILPGSANVIGGQGVTVRTVGRDAEAMARREPACLKVAFGLNVKLNHGVKSGRSPLTRMAIADLMRDAFEGALRYEARRALHPEQPEEAAQEVLLAALRRELPVRAHCARSDDILTALRIKRQFGFDLVLEHAHEAHLVLPEVVAAKVAVVLGPAFRCCGHSEELHFDFAATKLLMDAGVTVAQMTDHPIVPIGYLALQAGLCVRAGLTEDEALRVITANPAKILGISNQVGRLEVGLEADLVLLDGPPLAVASRVLKTVIGGEVVYRDGEARLVPGQWR